jgi:phospholipid/cholesterol/gamma-HCH transport system ATP-binding protein
VDVLLALEPLSALHSVGAWLEGAVGQSPRPGITAPAPQAAVQHAFIEVNDLVKRYDDKLVLDGFSLKIERGSTCVIIGGSGSGKSTFGRLLVGLERPDDGEIWVEGVDLVRLTDRALDRIRSKFAVVFQGHALLDSMSVFDNVAFPLRESIATRGHLKEADITSRVHLALQELEVDAAALLLPGALSGGMAKRVGIARAVVVEPKIMLYDEPTSGLDPVSSRIVDQLIERMRIAHCITSIVITHDMLTAFNVADHVVLLAHGKVVAMGPPDDVFRAGSKEIEPFAKSSGIDFDHLPQRAARPSPSELCATHDQATIANP